MRVFNRCCFLVGCLWVGVFGCNEAPLPQEVATVKAPIYGGVPDTTAQHMAVVALTNGPGTGSFCTGTLITPTVVLTAGHCLEDELVDDVSIFFGFDAGASDGIYIPIWEWLVSPDYDDSTLSDDIALIRLAHSAPSDIVPIPHLPFSQGIDTPDVGQTDMLTLVGFGNTENNTSDQKLRAYATVAFICAGPDPCWYQGWDVNPYTFAYDQVTMGTCPGDSGGPSFIERNMQEYVAGVTSYGDDPCDAMTPDSASVNTLVDPYEEWIDDFISLGGVEDCTSTGDEDADGFADCDDDQCAADPLCDVGDPCVGTPVVACGDRVNTTTLGAGAALSDYPCTGEYPVLGPELIYWVDAQPGTEITADLAVGGTSDHDLLVLGSDGVTCDDSECLAISNNSDQTAEQVTFTVPAGGAYIIVDTYSTPGAFTLDVACDSGGTVEICNSGVDDDGDGLVDCADPDCANAGGCFNPGGDAGPGDEGNKGGCQQSGDRGGLPVVVLIGLLGLLALRRRRRRRRSAISGRSEFGRR